jgi:hypothetical protein
MDDETTLKGMPEALMTICEKCGGQVGPTSITRFLSEAFQRGQRNIMRRVEHREPLPVEAMIERGRGENEALAKIAGQLAGRGRCEPMIIRFMQAVETGEGWAAIEATLWNLIGSVPPVAIQDECKRIGFDWQS